MKKTLIIVGVLVLSTALVYVFFYLFQNPGSKEQEDLLDDSLVTEDFGAKINYSNASENDIVVNTPKPGSDVFSGFVVSGKARGTWFFEAVAPFSLVDWDGRIIYEGYVTAQDDWMTEDFVLFEGTIGEFEMPEYSSSGALILRNDNPSALSEYDKAVEIPVFLKIVDY